MSKFTQNIISVRFLEVLEELINKRIVESIAEFCKRINYQPQSMSQIKGGKRDVTVELISKLFSLFNGNPIYILSGKGSRILNPEILSVVEEERILYGSGDEKLTIQTLEKLVNAKEDIILLLRKENHRLTTELKMNK